MSEIQKGGDNGEPVNCKPKEIRPVDGIEQYYKNNLWHVRMGEYLIPTDRKVKNYWFEIDEDKKSWVHILYFEKDAHGNDIMKVDWEWLISGN